MTFADRGALRIARRHLENHDGTTLVGTVVGNDMTASPTGDHGVMGLCGLGTAIVAGSGSCLWMAGQAGRPPGRVTISAIVASIHACARRLISRASRPLGSIGLPITT
jgi:hypothetical protein